MKISKKIKFVLLRLVLGLGLSIVQPVKGQTTNLVPLFQYNIFYNGLLEFSDCATLTFNGPVYCNSNIYVGTPASSTLTFNSLVTCSGIITNPAMVGMSQSAWTGTTKYLGTPAPGYETNALALTLSMDPSQYRDIINFLNPGDSPTNPITLQRYFYKADLVILVTNVTTALDGTNMTNELISVFVKGSMFDTNSLLVSYTNNLPTNTIALSNNWYRMNTNWAWFGPSNWLTTAATFYDARQRQTNHVTQIDVGKFGTWIATNTNCIAKWNAANPFNGIVYVADLRTTNGTYNMDCLRLTNGQTIPSIGASNIVSGLSFTTNYAYPISGLSFATLNPLYIAGYFNCPGTTNIGTTNTGGTSHCSVICDALTILSPSWQDGNSWVEATNGPVPIASSDTVNTAIIAGNVPSTGSGNTQYSGGVHNLTRLLENWSGETLTLNTSLINLYPSAQATAQFQQPPTYYSAPTRQFSFDQNFTNLSSLPPGTPSVEASFVTLTNLNQVFSGAPLAVTAVTMPPGLGVTVTYSTNGWYGNNTNPPVNAGTYFVTAIINNGYNASFATNVLVITKESAAIYLEGLTQTYDGSAASVGYATYLPGVTGLDLVVDITYDGSTNAPTNAGSYAVVATANDPNYQASTNSILVISQAPAVVNLANLSQTFDGTAKSVVAMTSPAGLAVGLTYNGATNAPTNAGSYVVVGTVNDPNYQGSATNTLVIAPPVPAPITVSGSTTLADGTFQLSFTNTPGVSFTVLGSQDPTVPLTNWTVVGSVIEVSPGEFQFTDEEATNLAQRFYVIRSP